tara:strand:+ start:656 stop:895 length:240 start_codon:yes stop_codon:yes gene_type:complete
VKHYFAASGAFLALRARLAGLPALGFTVEGTAALALAADFFATGFLTTAFLAVAFLADAFLATVFLPVAFFGADPLRVR